MIAEICATVAVVFGGAYALAWRVLAWERADVARFERKVEAETKGLQCPSLKRFAGERVWRCELETDHFGPHTAKAEGYERVHWE